MQRPEAGDQVRARAPSLVRDQRRYRRASDARPCATSPCAKCSSISRARTLQLGKVTYAQERRHPRRPRGRAGSRAAGQRARRRPRHARRQPRRPSRASRSELRRIDDRSGARRSRRVSGSSSGRSCGRRLGASGPRARHGRAAGSAPECKDRLVRPRLAASQRRAERIRATFCVKCACSFRFPSPRASPDGRSSTFGSP